MIDKNEPSSNFEDGVNWREIIDFAYAEFLKVYKPPKNRGEQTLQSIKAFEERFQGAKLPKWIYDTFCKLLERRGPCPWQDDSNIKSWVYWNFLEVIVVPKSIEEPYEDPYKAANGHHYVKQTYHYTRNHAELFNSIYAVMPDNFTSTKFLLEVVKNTNQRLTKNAKDMQNVLQYLAHCTQSKFFAQLVEHDIKHNNGNGLRNTRSTPPQTALMGACWKRRYKNIDVLLSYVEYLADYTNPVDTNLQLNATGYFIDDLRDSCLTGPEEEDKKYLKKLISAGFYIEDNADPWVTEVIHNTKQEIAHFKRNQRGYNVLGWDEIFEYSKNLHTANKQPTAAHATLQFNLLHTLCLTASVGAIIAGIVVLVIAHSLAIVGAALVVAGCAGLGALYKSGFFGPTNGSPDPENDLTAPYNLP